MHTDVLLRQQEQHREVAEIKAELAALQQPSHSIAAASQQQHHGGSAASHSYPWPGIAALFPSYSNTAATHGAAYTNTVAGATHGGYTAANHGVAMGGAGAMGQHSNVAMGGAGAMGGHHGAAMGTAAETLEDHRRDAYIPQKRAVDPKLRLPLQQATKRPAASQPPAYSAIMDPAAQLARNRSAAANRAAADVRYPAPSLLHP